MSMSREDLIILSAANIFAASTKNMSIGEAVSLSLGIEAEVKKQRHAKAVEEPEPDILHSLRSPLEHHLLTHFVDAEPVDYLE